MIAVKGRVKFPEDEENKVNSKNLMICNSRVRSASLPELVFHTYALKVNRQRWSVEDRHWGVGGVDVVIGIQNNSRYCQDVLEDHGHEPDQKEEEEVTQSKENKGTPLVHLLTLI